MFIHKVTLRMLNQDRMIFILTWISLPLRHRKMAVEMLQNMDQFVLCQTLPKFYWSTMMITLLTLDTASSHVKMCRWLTSYVPRSQFQVL